MEINIKEFLENIEQHIKLGEEVFIVGISGGSGSGKTYAAGKISEKLKDAIVFDMDDYIDGEKVKASENWDLPEIWRLDLLKEDLVKLKKGENIKKPIYDFTKHRRANFEDFKSKRIIILEGNYALHDLFLDLLDLKIFVDISEDIRLQRRVERDVKERGRTKEQVLEKWKDFVQPTYLEFVEPQKEKADLIFVYCD